MKISDETFQKLQKDNIKVSFYPCTKEEYYNERYEIRYQSMHAETYYKAGSERDEYAKKAAEKDCEDWYNADTLFVIYKANGKEFTAMKKVNIKSKEVTYNDIITIIEKDKKLFKSPYGDFCLKMRELLKKNELDKGCCVYPTTYGIGVWVFFNWNFDDHKKAVETLLKQYGVEYYNEFSDARLVYRFKISKKASNLSKLNC